jgi:type I restriction enzyme, S subunit
MTEWRTTTLGEVVELKRGYDLPAADREPGDVPIVSSSGITGYHSVAKVHGPGVVTGRYGTLGEVFLIEGDFWPLNTALYVRDFKGNDPRFVAALLESLKLGQNDGAAAVPGVNRNQLHRLPVVCPDTDTQRTIAAVFGALDRLIENNMVRVKVLEQMVQALYWEWFVRFRYPGHEHVPLVHSDLGPIPRGWQVCTIADLAAPQKYAVTSGPFGSKLGRKDYVESGVPQGLGIVRDCLGSR